MYKSEYFDIENGISTFIYIQLHIFALGPYVRKMCNPKRANNVCSKLSDYDDLCGRVSERHRLRGFYRAFMSTSTQWLSNLFAGICVSAKVVNMHVSFF
jgi:hypothetical protein